MKLSQNGLILSLSLSLIQLILEAILEDAISIIFALKQVRSRPPEVFSEKRCSKNMRQNCWTHMSKFDFNKATRQLYKIHNSAWVFSYLLKHIPEYLFLRTPMKADSDLVFFHYWSETNFSRSCFDIIGL